MLAGHRSSHAEADFQVLNRCSGAVQALYPVGNLMRGVALPAPPIDTGLYQPGQMKLSLTGVEAVPSGNASRLLLVMKTPWPAWGLLNVTGPVVGWSFAEENPEVRTTARLRSVGRRAALHLFPVEDCFRLCSIAHGANSSAAVKALVGGQF